MIGTAEPKAPAALFVFFMVTWNLRVPREVGLVTTRTRSKPDSRSEVCAAVYFNFSKRGSFCSCHAVRLEGLRAALERLSRVLKPSELHAERQKNATPRRERIGR